MIKKIHIITLAAIVSIALFACNPSGTDHDGSNNGGDDPTYSHTRQAGTSAHDFLADSRFTELEVEIDYMPGYKPKEQALDSLKAFFSKHLHKSTITIQDPTQIPSGGEDRYSASEIRSLEDQYRTTFSSGSRLAAYMIIVDGKYEERDLLGIAYYNTSNGFFGPSYDEVSNGTGPPYRYQIEALSFSHEFGHLFGLVNIEGSGTEMQNPHQDEAHGHHCDNDECLMYYASERTDLITGSISGDEIPELDQNCQLDLEANGGK